MPRRRRSKDRPSLEPSEEPPPDGDAGDAPGAAPAAAEGDGDRELSLDEAFGPEARPAVFYGLVGLRALAWWAGAVVAVAVAVALHARSREAQHRRYREEGLGQASAAAFARVAEGSYRDAAAAFRHLARFGEGDGFAEIWLARVGVEATRGYRGELGELGRELRGHADVMEGGCAHLEAIVAPRDDVERRSLSARAARCLADVRALRARAAALRNRALGRATASERLPRERAAELSVGRFLDAYGSAPVVVEGFAAARPTAADAARACGRRRPRLSRLDGGPDARGGLVWDDAAARFGASLGDYVDALRRRANGTRNGSAARPRALNVDQVFLASEDLTALCPELLDSVAVPRYAVGAALASPPRLTIRSPGSRVAAAVARGGLARWIVVSEGLADVRVLDEGGLGAAERGAGQRARRPRGSSLGRARLVSADSWTSGRSALVAWTLFSGTRAAHSR